MSTLRCIYLLLCVHNDQSSIDWIIRHHLHSLESSSCSLNIHILNSGPRLAPQDFHKYQDINPNASMKIFNLKELGLLEKVTYWYKKMELQQYSLIWLHPADQINSLHPSFLRNDFNFNFPFIYSGYELHIHRQYNLIDNSVEAVVVSTRSRLSLSPGIEDDFYKNQVQALLWDIYTPSALELLIKIYESHMAFSEIMSSWTFPSIVETLITYVYAKSLYRKRAPMLLFADTSRSAADIQRPKDQRPLFLSEYLEIYREHKDAQSQIDEAMNKSLLTLGVDLPNSKTNTLDLLSKVSQYTKIGFGKFARQLNIYVKFTDSSPNMKHHQVILKLPSGIVAFNLDFIASSHQHNPSLIPALDPCPLALPHIRDLITTVPSELWSNK